IFCNIIMLSLILKGCFEDVAPSGWKWMWYRTRFNVLNCKLMLKDMRLELMSWQKNLIHFLIKVLSGIRGRFGVTLLILLKNTNHVYNYMSYTVIMAFGLFLPSACISPKDFGSPNRFFPAFGMHSALGLVYKSICNLVALNQHAFLFPELFVFLIPTLICVTSFIKCHSPTLPLLVYVYVVKYFNICISNKYLYTYVLIYLLPFLIFLLSYFITNLLQNNKFFFLRIFSTL
ncbi:hypothetical protein L9F63_009499, partial [Diploptera punctata]